MEWWNNGIMEWWGDVGNRFWGRNRSQKGRDRCPPGVMSGQKGSRSMPPRGDFGAQGIDTGARRGDLRDRGIDTGAQRVKTGAQSDDVEAQRGQAEETGKTIDRMSRIYDRQSAMTMIYMPITRGVLLKRPYINMPTVIPAPIDAPVKAGFPIPYRDIPPARPAPMPDASCLLVHQSGKS